LAAARWRAQAAMTDTRPIEPAWVQGQHQNAGLEPSSADVTVAAAGEASPYMRDLVKEPWRFDFFAVLRRLERSFPTRPRIGASATRRDEYVVLGQDAYLEFPASNLSKVDRDAHGRLRMFAKFLGLLGPQGALPLATTEETHFWNLARDDAFARFLDIFNHRFLQLFFRAWGDARPVSQHDRPTEDRFSAYVGSAVGLGSAPYRDLDSVPDAEKLAFAGLVGPQAKSASRLESFLSGLFGIQIEIEQFVGTRLLFEEGERTLLGQRQCILGADALVGGSVFSLQDKFRIRIVADNLANYCEFLPTGKYYPRLSDAVFFYVGDQYEWDAELALPAGAVEPVRLGRFGQLGWTSWMAPNWSAADQTLRSDARFHPTERRKRRTAASI
jgi:type VI secretion system protein ImpH